MTTTRVVIGTAAAALLGSLVPATAHAVGATPGVQLGGDGASWQGHTERFVAVRAGRATRVTELRRAGGAAVAARTIAGRFGIPYVAYDGSTEQVPATSPAMVIAERVGPAALPRHTGLVVLSTRDLHVVRRVHLEGAYAFDALSPDGATMYLTQHASRAHITRYTVRAYDIPAGHLLPGVIADRTDHEWRMDGMPVTRLQTRDGAFAYTLYQGGEDGAFIHALDTRARTARCIDIPGMTHRDVMSMRLRLADGGRRLVVVAGPNAVPAAEANQAGGSGRPPRRTPPRLGRRRTPGRSASWPPCSPPPAWLASAAGCRTIRRMEDDREALRATFDSVAGRYDRARPEYPAAVFDVLMRQTGLRPGDRVVEVGCGTGKATRPLAERGLRLTCVELGAELAAAARANLARFPDVEVVNAAFETWRPPEGAAFDAVVAATAWHWADPQVRYRRAWELLRPGGHLAFWAAVHVLPAAGDPIFLELQDVYDEIGAGRIESWQRPRELPDVRGEILASGLFRRVTVTQFDWEVRYDAEGYVDLLETFSGHISMRPWQRERLYAEIRRRLAERPDGLLRRHWGAALHVASRIDNP